MHRSLINWILDDPDCAATGGVLCVVSGVVLEVGEGVGEGIGPVPLLQRSPPQQELQ